MTEKLYNRKEILTKIEKINPLEDDRFKTPDLITAGLLFSEVFGNIARYNTTSKNWYIYNGTIWKRDNENVLISDLAQALARALQVYIVEDTEHYNDESYRKFINSLGDTSKREKMLKDARSHLYIETTDFDKDKYLLNLLNGTLDLRNMKLKSHNPNDLITKCANVSYNKDIKPKKWNAFISEIFENEPGKIDYIKRLFGYSLTGEAVQDECYFMYGPTTRNGKSTLLNTYGYMLGDYAKTVRPETLAEQQIKRSGAAPSPDLADLAGCRFLHCSELPKSMMLNAELLKTLTGGTDRMKARPLFGNPFEYLPQFKLFFNTNVLPSVSDMTLFTSKRIKIVKFNRHFEDSEQEKHLPDKLKEPDNLSGLLNWCIDGLNEYKTKETTPPQCVINDTKVYAEESDKIQIFINENLEKSESTIKTKDLYVRYKNFCYSNGYYKENEKNFKQSLLNHGITLDKNKDKTSIIQGYSLKSEM